ncbi:MAG: glycosyltransferase WbuB [Proteobacteria bacterium]|nr:MAG: glycosyltransferase WbuB [Pseudomonadota bacterium]
MRVLHVLHTSLPHIAGYTIRSNYIIRFQKDHDLEPVVVTSAQDPSPGDREVIDGTTYIRTPSIPERLPPGMREGMLMQRLFRSVDAAIREFQPELVHAHSPMLVGLPALAAARWHRLPFVYEVRDLWENASVDRGKFKEDGLMYKGARGAESIIYRTADAVVAICEKLREVIAPRVGLHTALHVVGNGVEVEAFTPADADEELKATWGLAGKRCIGYIGTFQPYEGLSTLVAAMPAIKAAIPEAHLMITGAGGVEDELKAQVARDNLGELVTFTGRVPHTEVKSLYAIPELFVYPRILTRTTAITTPLKPLEAMATGKPVLVSDVGAMLELVKPGETGNVFEAGSARDLAEKAIDVLHDPERQQAMGKAARAFVEAERQWPHLVASYRAIYDAIPPR